MTLKPHWKVKLVAAAAIGALCGSVFADDVLRSGDVNQMSHWYGNAGGLTGSDRVEFLGKSITGNQPVGVTYDKDVAQRTNMPRAQAPNRDVGIVYDKDVADRTNMPRVDKSAPIQTTGVSSK